MGLSKPIQSGDYEHGDILIEYAGDKYANEQGDTDHNDHHDKCDPVELRLFLRFCLGGWFSFHGIFAAIVIKEFTREIVIVCKIVFVTSRPVERHLKVPPFDRIRRF